MSSDSTPGLAERLSALPRDQVISWATLSGLLLVLVWSYGNDLMLTSTYWDNPKYSHGYLIPVITAVLLWLLYKPFGEVTNSARWAGAGLLALGFGVRLIGTRYDFLWPQITSFVPCVLGLFLMVGGWSIMRWAAAPVLFLIFMFPLPGFLDGWLLGSLQKLATISSTYCLQSLGIPTYSEGNRIVISGDIPMGVVDACSGLRMLTIFMALAVAISLISDRPIWERVVIVLSAIPIALMVNIVRITVTGVLHLTAGPEIADKVFHDLAGWVMMPMALGLLYVEFQVLSHLIIEDGPSGPATIGGVRRPPSQPGPWDA